MFSTVLMCLALNVYHESRAEPLDGGYAVAHVTMNRVYDDRFPNDVCSVVKQGYRKGKRNCQFSWYCDGLSDKPKEKRAWDLSMMVAMDVLAGGVPDNTDGSLFFHADYVHPSWAKRLTKTVKYGSHIFYK